MENSPEDADKNHKRDTKSWGPAASSQSVSTSGSMGSPSSRSDTVTGTQAGDSAVLRLCHLELHGDDVRSKDGVASKKKKRGQRATGTDKSGRGLRQFSLKVCEKVESKGRTTYNEVADALVAEYADASATTGSNLQQGQGGYDEKNIRRRVYDALNVLMAMDIISKDKKEIKWRGLPRSMLNDIEELKLQAERTRLRNKVQKKAAYLKELELQCSAYQCLTQRNKQLYGNGNASSGGVGLPFILVQTRPNATVEVEISEDMQLVHFDFNSTPFELHDENYVLKQMQLCEKPLFDAGDQNCLSNPGEGNTCPPQICQPSLAPTPCQQHSIPTSLSQFDAYQHHHIPLPSTLTPTNIPTSPPLPGILKPRAQHDH